MIVLAGGLSKRLGQDKCLKELAGKPLIVHVLDRVARVADEKIVVAGSNDQQSRLSRIIGQRAMVVTDRYADHSPLIGASTAFDIVKGEHALLLPCDAAFVSTEIASLLLDLCVGRSAVIPRWPDGKIEPLQAAYNVKSASEAARAALDGGKRDMLSMIAHLRRVRYVSTLVLQQYDEKLTTFFNVNTVDDLKRAESMLKRTR